MARVRLPSGTGGPALELIGAADSDAVRSSFLRLAERFRPQDAGGLDATFVVSLAGRGATTVHVTSGRCLISPGRVDRPTATLATSTRTWLDLVAGRCDGIAAFIAGRLRIEGDLNLAARFETLFGPGPEVGRPLRHEETAVGSLQVTSIVAGAGRPVLLLHGLGASKVSFLPTLDGLADRYEVHALDLPGFGRSSAPLPTGRRYSMGWYAEVVRGYLDAQSLDRAVLVGNSMGGRIAVELGLRSPGRVDAVVGLGPAVAFDELRVLAPLLRLTRPHWAGIAPVPLPVDRVERFVRSLFHDPSTVPDDNHRAAADDAIRSLRSPARRTALLAAARHLAVERSRGGRAYWQRLAGLAVPSLWVFGGSDRLVASRYADRVRTTLPDAAVEVWDDVGHVPQFEVPERTNAAIASWLATAAG